MYSWNISSIIIKESISYFINETSESWSKEKLSATYEYLSQCGAAKEVCGFIINYAEEKYKFTCHLLAENLFEYEIGNLKTQFPDGILDIV